MKKRLKTFRQKTLCLKSIDPKFLAFNVLHAQAPSLADLNRSISIFDVQQFLALSHHVQQPASSMAFPLGVGQPHANRITSQPKHYQTSCFGRLLIYRQSQFMR